MEVDRDERVSDNAIDTTSDEEGPVSDVEELSSDECSFGNLSCITTGKENDKKSDGSAQSVKTDESAQSIESDVSAQRIETDVSAQKIETDVSEQRIETDVPAQRMETDVSAQRIETDVPAQRMETNENDNADSMYGSIENYTFDPSALIEVSDILGLVEKNWSLFHVSPLWNLDFSKKYLNLLSKRLHKFLMNNINTNIKGQKNSVPLFSVQISAQEPHHECVALKIVVINEETNAKLYTGFLLKSPNYTEKYNKNKLSDMPVSLVQGNQAYIIAVHNWLTDHFDCIIRPYAFALYQFLWIIAISMGDAGKLYNDTVLYNYIYKYELSKGQMDIKCYVESSFLRSVLAKLSLNKSSSEATSFHYSDLIKVQSEIEENFKLMCGINVSKLKLKTFEAPKIASINISGKIHIRSPSLMDLILKYLMELENNSCVL